jgi:hypothetical protein
MGERIPLTDLARDFLRVIELAERQEGTAVPERVGLRLARAFSQAVEKAFCVGWRKDGDEIDPKISNPGVLRAAERGVLEYLP